MLTSEQAQTVVLNQVNNPNRQCTDDELFVVSYCRLSPRKDFWVISANSKAYIIDGDQSKCYVGVGAYLVDVESGDLTIVGSGQSLNDYFQDMYDDRTANGKVYLLRSGYNSLPKAEVITLKNLLGCDLKESRELLIGSSKDWVYGKNRVLVKFQNYLIDKGIKTEITLSKETKNAIELKDLWFIQKMIERLKERLNA